MYYLWKDKKSNEDQVFVYITDYKEIRYDGKVKIDGQGYLDVELIKSSPYKIVLVMYAQTLIQN